MHILTPLLSLATLVSALDIRLHSTSNCGGWSTDCPNINPSTCCAGANGVRLYPSIRYAAVPPSWSIQVRAYNWRNGVYCGDLAVVQSMSGDRDRCINGGGFGGGGYNFVGRRKRGDGKEEDDERGGKGEGEEKCKETQQASVLTMGNGLRYDISGMEEGVLKELVGMAQNGTLKGDVPVGYGKYAYKG